MPPSTSVETFTALLEKTVPGHLDEFGVPGAAVALIEGGDVVFVQGYGYADAANRQPVTAQTGFNVASISKPVTAWGIMRLVERGKLELDAPVERYLTRWQFPPSEFDASHVTVRRLLSHTAGLSVTGYSGWSPGDELPTLEESLNGATNGSGDVRLILAPGTQWRYSGGGYTVMQLLVEEITGTKFSDYMREEVLLPLGMSGTDFEWTPSIQAASAQAYDQLGEPAPIARFTAQAAGGMHTTIENLATFAAAALNGPDGTAGRGVIRPESVDVLTSPAPATEGRYGLGYGIAPFGEGMVRVGHDGSNRGWHSLLEIIPETGDGFVMITNSSNGWSAYQQVFCDWVAWKTGSRPKCEKSIGSTFAATLRKGGLEAAREQYHDLKKANRDEYRFNEHELNRVGYALLQAGQARDAIIVLSLNVEEYPNASNPYDSLGEAYMAAGEKEAAKRNYRKSLELNPENNNAADMLKKLQEQK